MMLSTRKAALNLWQNAKIMSQKYNTVKLKYELPSKFQGNSVPNPQHINFVRKRMSTISHSLLWDNTSLQSRTLSSCISMPTMTLNRCHNLICVNHLNALHGAKVLSRFYSNPTTQSSSKTAPKSTSISKSQQAAAVSKIQYPREKAINVTDVLVSTKRTVRKRKPRSEVPKGKEKEIFDVTAYSTSEEIDLESLTDSLKSDGLYTVLPMPEDCEDVLHVEAYYRVENQPREILFFRDGAIVFWNVPQVERNTVLRKTRDHQEFVYDSELIEEEQENVSYIFTESNTHLIGDEIYLQNPETSGDLVSHQLEKYTFSNVLANSVKLAIWEASLNKYVDSIEFILQDLKAGKKLKISRREVLRKTGELLTLRHLVNLSSDLLDLPDFYWNREELEALYQRTQNQLNISKRVKVMNDKLNHCCELTELLREHLNDKHHTQLEWLIILLIALEVFFEIMHMAGIK